MKICLVTMTSSAMHLVKVFLGVANYNVMLDADEEEGLSHAMQQMDKELANTTMATSFDRIEQQQQGEGLKPVDIDFNLVKNLLESYTSQEGGAGPTSNILQSMGIKMPER